MLYSIIVPVYKVEAYLRACVDSLLEQTFSDFEIILVDDGSPDECPRICDEYASRDERVKVIHKENGGLSDARNCGMNVAEGAYIMFLDSDDLLAPGCLEKMAKQLENHPDMLITEIFDTVDVTVYPKDECLFPVPEIENKQQLLQFLLYKKKHTWSAPQYILNRSFVHRHALRFDVGFYHEDVSWSARVFAVAQTFSFYNGVWYVRRLERQGSITNTINPKRTVDMLTLVHKQIYNELITAAAPKEREALCSRLIGSAIGSLRYYRQYDEAAKKNVAEKVKAMQKDFHYAKGWKHKGLVAMMKGIGIHNTLMLFGML